MASRTMNIAPGQNRLSSYGFTKQKRSEPLADGVVSAADHAAKLPANIQEASDAQARELEERRVAAAAKPKNPVGRPLKFSTFSQYVYAWENTGLTPQKGVLQ